MTKAEFLAILEKNLDGTASQAERKLLDDFYHRHLRESRVEWTLTEKERIRLEIFESLNSAIDKDVRQSRRGIFWKVAASVAVLIAAGLGLYLMPATKQEVLYTTMTTQRGEQNTVALPDGSVVRLNAESSITYPEKFTELASRDVILSGEAFFDVVRDESKPFIIRSGGLVTTVLGTSFNIQAYPDDALVAVTVATGKVKIELAGSQKQNESVLLLPGEQGLYDSQSSGIRKATVKLERYLAWKDGTILLEGASLKEATDILGRWYNAEFVFKSSELTKCTIDGKFKNEGLENILENLRFLIGLKYHVEEGNRIVIDGQSCN